MLVRTKDQATDKVAWQYFDDVKTFPRRTRTSPIGRRITVQLPVGLQKYVQVCSLYTANNKKEEGNSAVIAMSLESCANVPMKDR